MQKIYEGRNLGLYFLGPATPNKEIPHRFNLTIPKEYIMHILYAYVIYKSEIYHRKHMCSNIHGRRRLHLCLPNTIQVTSWRSFEFSDKGYRIPKQPDIR